MDYVLHIGTLVGIYAILAMSLGLLVGKTGIISFCHAIFYGCGGYGAALVAHHWGAPFHVGIVTGIIASGMLALAVGSVMARFPRDVSAMSTVVVQVVCLGVLMNWDEVTRGSLGVWGINSPSLVGWQITSNRGFLCLTWAIVVFVGGVLWLVQRSPYGRVLMAIREDPTRATSLGKSVTYGVVSSVVLSATLASLAGSVYAHFVTYVSPESFSFQESMLVLAIVIVGGAGRISGAIVGAAVIVVLPEIMALASPNSASLGNIRQILFGTMLVAVIVLRPRGVLRGAALDGEERTA